LDSNCNTGEAVVSGGCDFGSGNTHHSFPLDVTNTGDIGTGWECEGTAVTTVTTWAYCCNQTTRRR
jgi:hypothetical protein